MAAAAMPTPIGSVRDQVPQMLRSYRGDVIDELLEESRATSTSVSRCATQHSSKRGDGNGSKSPAGHPGQGRDDDVAERAAAQRTAREAALRAKDEQFQRQLQERIENEAARKEAEFQTMYADVLEGLSNTTGIMGDTEYTLKHNSRIKAQKKRELYQEWDTEVFSKIQDRLQGAVDAQTTEQLETRLKSQMDDYLHTTNTKLGVFRDVIDTSCYNPMTAHQSAIQIPTGDIYDPVKRDLLKTQREKALMPGSGPASLPLGKHTLDTKAWSTLNIKATPYGHCMDETGAYNIKPTPEAALKVRASRVKMDHYDFPNHDNAVPQHEAGRPGKSTKAAVPGAGPNGLFGVLQQTGVGAPADRWVDHKSKAMPDGPEKRRGRPNLDEIIQQTSNAYEDGRSLGDAWLEAKGKAMPPGPEMRRGRPNLDEIVQQSSNPYVDGRSLGDTWLEAKGKQPVAAAAAASHIGATISRTDGEPQPVVGGKYIPTGLPQCTSNMVMDGSLTTKRANPKLL